MLNNRQSNRAFTSNSLYNLAIGLWEKKPPKNDTAEVAEPVEEEQGEDQANKPVAAKKAKAAVVKWTLVLEPFGKLIKDLIKATPQYTGQGSIPIPYAALQKLKAYKTLTKLITGDAPNIQTVQFLDTLLRILTTTCFDFSKFKGTSLVPIAKKVFACMINVLDLSSVAFASPAFYAYFKALVDTKASISLELPKAPTVQVTHVEGEHVSRAWQRAQEGVDIKNSLMADYNAVFKILQKEGTGRFRNQKGELKWDRRMAEVVDALQLVCHFINQACFTRKTCIF